MKYESSFKSEADGLEISVMALIPDKKPYRAIVQLVHGMSEHKDRYIPFMQYLAKLGYVVVIHDHRGHGKSVKHQDDLGFTYGGGAQAMLQDIRTVNRKIHAYYPELPLILMGHSMGSLAVRAFVAEHDSCVDMLIVCGSPSYNTAMPLGVAIAKTEKAVFGPRHRSKLIETMSFGAGAMKFRKDKRCTAWICSDPDVAKEYEESEMCGFTFTDDAYLALFELMKRAYDVEHFSCTNPDMPVLFVSGAEDPCLINVRHFAKTVRAMRRAGYKDVKGKLYPGMRHEILNEIGREQVYHDIAVYMRKKVEKDVFSETDITYPVIKTDSGWKIVSLDDETVKIMSANFKSVEEEINNSLNNMDNEDSSGSSSNAPEASADDTLNLTTEKFTIKYTKHTITKDFAGNPCIMVYYDYTNNSSSASSAMVDVSLKAYQHGESCEAAIPENNDDAIDHFTAEIQPGQTVNVCQAFTLTDESDVTVQAQEAFSFDEDANARQILKVK